VKFRIFPITSCIMAVDKENQWGTANPG